MIVCGECYMEKKRVIGKILLISGFIPWGIGIGYGIYSSIRGFSVLCIFNCTKEYGFRAFMSSLILYSYVFWPTYVIGLVLIILVMVKLRGK